MNRPQGLIGGLGMTEVHVYAQRPAPDGKFSGCPHVHAVTDEAYFVLRGSGSVEFHDQTHGLRTLELTQGMYVHFPPMVMHRLISDGDLIVLGIMANAGLAESGDARIYFGSDVDDHPERFEELQTLPRKLGLEGALKRRDEAVKAYQSLMQLWHNDQPAYFAELKRFFHVHAQAMAQHAEHCQGKVRTGPVAWATATQQRIDALPQTRKEDRCVWINRPGDDDALGMCGILRPVISLQNISQPL